MDSSNAHIPTGRDELPFGKEVYYINNTLVPVIDGSRIIEPLDDTELREKREQYN